MTLPLPLISVSSSSLLLLIFGLLYSYEEAVALDCTVSVVSKGWYDTGATYARFYVNGVLWESGVNGWNMVKVLHNCTLEWVERGLDVYHSSPTSVPTLAAALDNADPGYTYLFGVMDTGKSYNYYDHIPKLVALGATADQAVWTGSGGNPNPYRSSYAFIANKDSTSGSGTALCEEGPINTIVTCEATPIWTEPSSGSSDIPTGTPTALPTPGPGQPALVPTTAEPSETPTETPTNIPTALLSAQPISAIPSSLPPFSASGTNNALENTAIEVIYICPGPTLTFSTCSSEGGSCSGDIYLRLYDASNVNIASNDDSCNYCSSITYTFTAPCQNYQLYQGCYSTGSCSGQVAISGIPIPTTSPTDTPTPTPLPTPIAGEPTLVPSLTRTSQWIWNPDPNQATSTWSVTATPGPVSYCGSYHAPYYLCSPWHIVDGTEEMPLGISSGYTAYDYEGMSGPPFYFTVDFGEALTFDTWRLAGSGSCNYG